MGSREFPGVLLKNCSGPWDTVLDLYSCISWVQLFAKVSVLSFLITTTNFSRRSCHAHFADEGMKLRTTSKLSASSNATSLVKPSDP